MSRALYYLYVSTQSFFWFVVSGYKMFQVTWKQDTATRFNFSNKVGLKHTQVSVERLYCIGQRACKNCLTFSVKIYNKAKVNSCVNVAFLIVSNLVVVNPNVCEIKCMFGKTRLHKNRRESEHKIVLEIFFSFGFKLIILPMGCRRP